MSDEQLVDLENRDPNNLNDDVKVLFDDFMGEPEGAHAADCVWINSFKCFNCCKNCCYKLLTGLCALPLACVWGLEFATTTFCHVWLLTPCMKCCTINMGWIYRAWNMCVRCYVRPFCEAYGYVLNNIRVYLVKD